ncbi:glycoside hydrolase family 7 protein [Apiospora arundinis]
MSDLSHVFMLPFLENLKFIGRKAISEAIEERLFGLQECRELAIVGLGGIRQDADRPPVGYSRPACSH